MKSFVALSFLTVVAGDLSARQVAQQGRKESVEATPQERRVDSHLLRNILRRVSDPEDVCYGSFLDRDDVDELFPRSTWSSSQSQKRDTVDADKKVSSHVRDSHGQSLSLDRSNVFQELRSESQTSDCTNTFWTPECLRRLYGVTDYEPSSSSGSRVAWAAFFGMGARYEDVLQYEETYNIPRRNFTIEMVSGGSASQDISDPAQRPNLHSTDLDAFDIVALTKGRLPLLQYSVGGMSPPYRPNAAGPTQDDNSNEPYLELFEYMLGKTNEEVPQVLTMSFSDDEQTVPLEYAEQVCNAIGLLGLRGITVIQTLAGKGPGSVCLSNDGDERPEFTPQFPASCPYITGVGEVNQSDPLVTWNISSGGFSNLFPRPWYQEEATERYFENYADKDALEYYRPFFNRSGRASPDLSLMGFSPEYQGDFTSPRPQPSGGTRGNAAWAGLVALLNDSRLRAGLPAMGFINPWLYKTGIRGLTDVTQGGSLGCMGENIQFHRPISGSQRIPWVGWNATEGWDPATGLGFPDFQRLQRLAMQIDVDRKKCPPRWWKYPWYWQTGIS
ncbi:tripeptidyl peptidase A [Lecanosticta acicola]|uniref:Tripeptidyl peptidase A n=1 Tax=Lecanosticta acicola TaxID=111012 RepID=A0AAI8Z7C7_9PEZI|nr:tripeptidyl peptidase A [Lecanosticta acicola]